MASIQISGVIRNPNETLAAGGEIRLTHKSNTGEVVKNFVARERVETDGTYDFSIAYGLVFIETRDYGVNKWTEHGIYTVNQDSTATTLPELLLTSVPPTNEQLLEFQSILADAVTAKNEAQASAASIDNGQLFTDYVQAVTGAKNTIIVDNFGNYQHVYRMPVFTFEDLAIPDCPFTGPLDAFRRQGGSIRPYIDVAMHEMANVGGKSVSQAGLNPWASINTDYTRARCEELAENAVMAGRYVAALLGWLMISKGFQPRGNTEYGRSHSHINEFGQRSDGRVPNDRAGAAKVLTGTGPNEWRHDGTAFGVSNWVGNMWERDEDWKLVDSQIYVAEYMGQPEANWLATGRYINTGHKFSMTPELTGASNQMWSLFTKTSDYVEHELLQRLLIEPIECTKVLGGRFYYNLEGERFPLRGGGWSNASDAGPAALRCNLERSLASSDIGGRSAFVS